MEALAFTLKEDFRELSGLTDRRFASVFKKALFEVLALWQRNYLRRHFLKGAYSWYAEAYQTYPKKERGMPLVRTGNLRSKVLSRSNARIHGTANGAKIDILFGQPAQFTGKRLMQKLEEYRRQNPTVKRSEAWRIVLERMQWGQEQLLARRVLQYMKAHNMTLAAAQKMVYGFGYPEEQKAMFQELLSYVNESEQRDMAKSAWGTIQNSVKNKRRQKMLRG